MIAQEKGHQQLRHGIEQFDTAKMNKVETLEKNPLPTQEGNHLYPNMITTDSFDRLETIESYNHQSTAP